MENERRNAKGIAKTRQVMLTVTRHCNLNCRYCYESHKGGGKRMSAETAKRILANEFERTSHDGVTEALDISFMGGEPLEEFDLIREISEWIWSKSWPLPYELSLPTNGTLLTDKMREWFTANRKRFSVGLSFDGLSGVNEINRTSLPIDYEYFIKTWPERRIAVVLFRDSIQFLAENVRQMNERKMPFTAVLGDGFEWSEEDARIYEEQMINLMPDYLENPDEARASGLFSLRIADFFPGNRLKESAFCGAVDNIVNYDVDGKDYICHIFAPLTLGQELADKAKKDCAGLEIVPWDPKCDDCPIRNTCKPCFGFHMKMHGDVNKWSSPKTICKVQKAKARMCCLYHLKRMELKIGRMEILSEEELMASDKALQYLNLEEKE